MAVAYFAASESSFRSVEGSKVSSFCRFRDTYEKTIRSRAEKSASSRRGAIGFDGCRGTVSGVRCISRTSRLKEFVVTRKNAFAHSRVQKSRGRGCGGQAGAR